MANKTPEQIAEKFQRRLAASGADYSAGVQNPSRDWATATKEGRPRWEQGIQEAIAERRFERGVDKAGTAKWQERASTVGAQRFQQAAPAAAEAYRERAQEIMGAANAARNAANALPNTTYEERKARAAAAMDASREYWRSRRGG